jgi:hypothetical protein
VKLNEKGKIRLLRDFSRNNLRMGDVFIVYKYRDFADNITYLNPKTYLKFDPKDVKELSDNAKEYVFKIFISDKYVGKMSVIADSVKDAYDTMLEIIRHRSYKAFPELDIEYSVQIIEDGDDKE